MIERARQALLGAACLLFTVCLLWAVRHLVALPAEQQALSVLLSRWLPDSGVSHPVTAVLLNFRSYDTLLEIGVLVIAGMVGISLARTSALEDPAMRSADPLLHALLRLFLPLLVLLAGWLLWAGSSRPGGAFQAGALLAAAGVLGRLAGLPMAFLRPGTLLRAGLVLGFSVFLLIALLGALDGRAFLAYPPGLAGALILVIEAGLSLSIGMILLALFVSAPVAPEEDADGGPPA
ncbi:MnhB domain-containing protein [Haliea atlantica]|jgi:multisubunit Na+/H+ antiporter MnhB subunit|tara:strand:+ start:47781 stop:48485 length:705 start_codon:yes stop_codon:yes gene_type:complete